MVAILSNQREAIFDAVRAMYTDVAANPWKIFHFPTGHEACEFVGYPQEQLECIPAAAIESFAGVGYPFAAEVIRAGDTVLDVGSGAGTDALIACGLVGPRGRVIGLDMTDAMLSKLERNAGLMRVANVEPLKGNAEAIPLPDESVDVVTSNGVLNLVPDKSRAIAEIFRVLLPGGHVQIADIVLGKPVSDACRADPRLWAECVVGATMEDVFLGIFRSVGFRDIEVLSHLDYFSASASEYTRSIAAGLGAQTLVMRATR